MTGGQKNLFESNISKDSQKAEGSSKKIKSEYDLSNLDLGQLKTIKLSDKIKQEHEIYIRNL